jgi:hypothetical protein
MQTSLRTISDVFLKEVLESSLADPALIKFSEALQYRLVTEELRRLIVDKQNVNRNLGHDAIRYR